MRPTLAALALFGLLLRLPLSGTSVGFDQTNLVSNGIVPANVIDSDLVNPWGIAFGPSTPFWIADNLTSQATLYTGTGAKQGLIVSIPPGGSAGRPTGVVFNSDANSFLGDHFLFATENGTIAGWNSGTAAAVRVDLSASDAVFKGLAIAGSRIYATDFRNAKVDVFDQNYAPVTGLGFTDPNIPAGYAPFGIADIGGFLYVTFAKQSAGKEIDVPGAGFGFVDKFNLDGTLAERLVSHGPLNSPWGLSLAPAGFGDVGGLLLVGNFGDGRINAFDPATGAFVTTLDRAGGNPITIDGLWALSFGNNGPGFSPDALYFTSGPSNLSGGLFGELQPAAQAAPEPGTTVLLCALLAGVVLIRSRGWSARSPDYK
jgi:uncharacterized protein (TIGR03118 family)